MQQVEVLYMVFSSIFFLYLFLPLTLLLYLIVGRRFKNSILLTASLLFYAWGEMGYVFLMLFSIAANWAIGLSIDKRQKDGQSGKMILAAGIVVNLIPLAYFKYGNFFIDNLSTLFGELRLAEIESSDIHLPIGISFFTFQAISYIVDVYRSEADVQKSPVNLALYISLFPQLIAGPIVRYHDIAKELIDRATTLSDFRDGAIRFITGLAKKVLIANNMGAVADHIFSLPPGDLPAGLAWLGIIAFTLQIYYDFSGYSDMAIGLGRMFGLHFLENFNYPYISTSITEFWRRWHISLSSWFRDYLYIPLGGNRISIQRTYFNLMVVFFLCGLWHGASWVFVVWGIYHGFFLILERSPIGRILDGLPRPAKHIYTLLVVMIGWIFFRSSDLHQAFDYIGALFNFSALPYLDAKLFAVMNMEFYLALIAGLVFALPVVPFTLKSFLDRTDRLPNEMATALKSCASFLLLIWMGAIFLYCSGALISGTHNPFLYFRF